jgi:hypothetical protein|tara:strand:+ start:16794 stop:17405 length:612 start_codon:yes stop_codon:yes gene_type:complete
MLEELKARFGAENITVFKQVSENLEILHVQLEQNNNPISVLLTHGLSNYKMPVHERYQGREYNELFFCIPRYWDLKEIDNPNLNWPVLWLEKLVNHVVEKNLWYGPGHSIQCYSDYKSLSETMKQNHLMLIDPILLKEEMSPLVCESKTIYFLAGMPIFGEEMDYKQGKGTYKLLTKFLNNNYNEKLDDYRESVLTSRMKFWR